MFYFDDDKLYTASGAVQTPTADNVSDVLFSASATKITTGKTTLSYTYGYVEAPLDSDYRFIPTSRLCRIQTYLSGSVSYTHLTLPTILLV